MSYSGAMQAKQAREILGRALATLQVEPNMPADGQDVASYMAQSVGSLFAAENAPNDTDGRTAVRASLGLLGQALAKMQMIQPPVAAIENAMGTLAQAMGILFPLTTGPEPVQSGQPSQTAGASAASKATLVYAEIPEPAQGGHHAQAAQHPQPMAAQPVQPVLHAVAPAPVAAAAAASPVQPVAAQAPQAVQAGPAAHAPLPNALGVPAPTGQPAMGYGAPVVQPTWHETVPTPAPHVVPAALVAAAMPDQPALAPLGHPEPHPAAASTAQPAREAAPQTAQTAQTAQAGQLAQTALPPVSLDGRPVFEANIGVRTETNFWVGFEDDIGQGGVFMPTYEDFVPGSRVALRVTLPKGASFVAPAEVRFLRDAVEFGDPHPPGVGFRFEGLGADQRELARQFMQRRRPIFYDVS